VINFATLRYLPPIERGIRHRETNEEQV
jgi:hypothetical protein